MAETTPAPSRRRIRLRRTLAVVSVLALVGAGAAWFTGEMRTTRAQTAEVDANVLALRAERVRLQGVLARTDAELQQTWDERTLRTAQRTTLDRRLDALYSRLLGVNHELSDLVASAALHVLALDVTKQCLFGVQRATEQAAVDDVRGSSASLDAVASACTRARAAGQRS